jgi:hypothetical protein
LKLTVTMFCGLPWSGDACAWANLVTPETHKTTKNICHLAIAASIRLPFVY